MDNKYGNEIALSAHDQSNFDTRAGFRAISQSDFYPTDYAEFYKFYRVTDTVEGSLVLNVGNIGYNDYVGGALVTSSAVPLAAVYAPVRLVRIVPGTGTVTYSLASSPYLRNYTNQGYTQSGNLFLGGVIQGLAYHFAAGAVTDLDTYYWFPKGASITSSGDAVVTEYPQHTYNLAIFKLISGTNRRAAWAPWDGNYRSGNISGWNGSASQYFLATVIMLPDVMVGTYGLKPYFASQVINGGTTSMFSSGYSAPHFFSCTIMNSQYDLSFAGKFDAVAHQFRGKLFQPRQGKAYNLDANFLTLNIV